MVKREDFRAIEQRLMDQEWRLDNLYYIQDSAGQTIKFERNDAQRAFWADLWYLNCVLKARQLGFSTFIAILMLDTCLFNSSTRCGIVDLTLDDAKKKLAKIRFAYERLPPALQLATPLTLDNATSVEFGNGSAIEVGTSHRGGTLQILHVSEFGKIAAKYPEKAREIKTGAFGTIHKGQMIHVESTAEGTAGDFFDMVQNARNLEAQGRAPTAMEFKLHFVPWWKHPDYVLDAPDFPISADIEKYFRDLKAEHGIACSPQQIAWYAAKAAQIGPDDMLREYPSTPDEAFQSAIVGAYFKRELMRARQQGRIGKVPFDPGRPVNTFWDIGVNDTNAIWFHQTDGKAHHFIDYYENNGEGLPHYVGELKLRRERFGYSYGLHVGPHDLENREWGSNAKSRIELARDLELRFEVVPRVEHKPDAIEAARTLLNLSWFDQEKCAKGIACLENYRKEWNERTQTYHNRPLHNWASNGADAYQTGAMGFRVPNLSQLMQKVAHGEYDPAEVGSPDFAMQVRQHERRAQAIAGMDYDPF